MNASDFTSVSYFLYFVPIPTLLFQTTAGVDVTERWMAGTPRVELVIMLRQEKPLFLMKCSRKFMKHPVNFSLIFSVSTFLQIACKIACNYRHFLIMLKSNVA